MRAILWSLLIAWALGCAAGQTPAPAVQPAEQVPTVPIPNAKSPEPGIVTGGRPSEENLREASSLGYRTVVSLLPLAQDEGEADLAGQLGLRFVSIPIAGADDLTQDNARRLGEVLGDETARPLILHCASGNRAGALLALEAFHVRGLPAADALELGKRAGLTKLEPAVRERLGLPAAQ